MTTLRISLTLDNFKQLVAGKIITKELTQFLGAPAPLQVEISLQDLGWGLLQQALDDARMDQIGLG